MKTLHGSRTHKHLKKYSTRFNEIFNFFLMSYRKGILNFCGSNVEVKFDINGPEGKFGFRMFDNGEMDIHNLVSSQPNVLRSVIIGKKSWGLWLNEWTDGIVEGSFTKNEIISEFTKNGIEIPESLYLDFQNRIFQKHMKKYGRVV